MTNQEIMEDFDEDKYIINRVIKELKENYGMIYIEDYVEFC